MQALENNHNANLLYTVSDITPVVNYYDRLEDYTDYRLEHCPDKLFVKIPNSIQQQELSLRVLEFYCQFSYLVYAYPQVNLSTLRIQSLIVQYTTIKLSKNTITKYLGILKSKNLIKRVGKWYVVDNKDIENSLVNNNIHTTAKGNFTHFFITIYNTNTIKGSMALELYMASKPYYHHRPNKVCKDLNISRKTYYKYLKEVVSKKIVTKIKFNNNYDKYRYANSYRKILLNDYNDIKETRYIYQGFTWHDRIKCKTKTRKWYESKMGPIMKQYGIKYIKAFDNYDPLDAYDIAQSIINQYGLSANAAIIVKGIISYYNWIKIVDNRHARIKYLENQVDKTIHQKTMIFNHC